MPTLPQEIHALEAARIGAALAASDYNVSRAAESLGIGATSLRRRLERHPELLRRAVELGPGRGRPRRVSSD